MTGSFDPGAKLGPRLRQVREQRGLSARELARRIQCSPSLISQIERGLSAPSVGMLYALATELRTSLDFLFSAAPADGLTVTAHGDGHLREEAHAPAALPGGHGIVQRAGTRRTIDLASGVRWERLTPGPDERVDFLEVIYEPSGHSTDARRPLRHDGREYGLITERHPARQRWFRHVRTWPGRLDRVRLRGAAPVLERHHGGRARDLGGRAPSARARLNSASPGGTPRNPRWPAAPFLRHGALAPPESSLARGCGSMGWPGSRCGGRTGNCGGGRCRGRLPDHTAGGRSRKRASAYAAAS